LVGVEIGVDLRRRRLARGRIEDDRGRCGRRGINGKTELAPARVDYVSPLAGAGRGTKRGSELHLACPARKQGEVPVDVGVLREVAGDADADLWDGHDNREVAGSVGEHPRCGLSLHLARDIEVDHLIAYIEHQAGAGIDEERELAPRARIWNLAHKLPSRDWVHPQALTLPDHKLRVGPVRQVPVFLLRL